MRDVARGSSPPASLTFQARVVSQGYSDCANVVSLVKGHFLFTPTCDSLVRAVCIHEGPMCSSLMLCK